jgi:hypothetical protein
MPARHYLIGIGVSYHEKGPHYKSETEGLLARTHKQAGLENRMIRLQGLVKGYLVVT